MTSFLHVLPGGSNCEIKNPYVLLHSKDSKICSCTRWNISTLDVVHLQSYRARRPSADSFQPISSLSRIRANLSRHLAQQKGQICLRFTSHNSGAGEPLGAETVKRGETGALSQQLLGSLRPPLRMLKSLLICSQVVPHGGCFSDAPNNELKAKFTRK